MMSEEVSLSVIKETQEALSKYVKKPPLTEKLLKKPPFRYLHDIVTAIIRETGFLEGLYTADELDSNNVKEKEAKISFLDKLIVNVAKASGKNLSVKSAKIVAGIEVHKTLELLKIIGEILDQKINTSQKIDEIPKILRERPEKSSTDKSNIELKNEKKSEEIVASGKKKENPTSDKTKPIVSEKITSKTKQSKTQKISPSVVNGRDQISKREKPIKNLQQLKVSNRGESTASQSKAIIKETTIDKRSTAQNESTLTRKSSLKGSSRNVINSTKPLQATIKEDIKEGHNERIPSIKQTRLKDDGEQKPKKKVITDQSSTKMNDDSSTMSKEEKRVLENGEILNQQTTNNNELRTNEVIKSEVKIPSEDVTPAKSGERKESATVRRPGSARPGSRKPSNGDLQLTGSTSNAIPIYNSEKGKDEIKPKVPSSIRPRTANRPSSARPGAPRIRDRGEVSTVEDDHDTPITSVNVIEEGTKDQAVDDEDSFIVIESKQPSLLANEQASIEETDQGQLVHQILKTQKELSEGLNAKSSQKSVEIEWEAGRKLEEDSTFKEVEKIRDSIQSLTSAANPIGKLFDFLQEDVEEMQRELQHWKDVNEKLRKRQISEFEFGKISLQSLQKQLADIENNIQEEYQQIANIKMDIFDNDEKIIRLAAGAVNTSRIEIK